jgi:hypothetical protein
MSKEALIVRPVFQYPNREESTYEDDSDNSEDHNSLRLFLRSNCLVSTNSGFQHTGLLLFEIEKVL